MSTAADESCAAATHLTPHSGRATPSTTLRVPTAYAGSSATKTHDRLKFAVQAIYKGAGLATSTDPIGGIPSIDNAEAPPPNAVIRNDSVRETGSQSW